MPEKKHLSSPPAENNSILDLARTISGRMPPQELSQDICQEIAQLAIQHGLGPLLWWELRQLDSPGVLTAVIQQLEGSAKVAAFNYQIFLEHQAAVQRALAQAGIPCIWLKGNALAQALYPQPQLRPMDDLDLLVPYEQHQAALQVITQLGYHFPPEHSLARKLHDPGTTAHHYHLIGGSPGEITLEIHFRLLEDESLLPDKRMDWFWQQSEQAGQDPSGFRILKPEAHLLYLCAHTILQHGEFDFRLQRFYDLHLLAARSKMNWELVVGQARHLGWEYTVWRALSLTHFYFSTPIPQPVFDALKNYRTTDRDFIHARHFQGAGYRWEMRMMRLSGLPWAERVRQLFHLTFPPADYMRTWYNIPPGRALLPYYLFRWSDAAMEIATATLRRLRGN